MASLNEKPVRLLMHDMAAAFQLAPEETFSRETAIEWFKSHYPNVKEGTVAAHLIRLSTNAVTRLHYSVRSDGSDDLFYKVDSSHFRLYRPGQDPTPVSPQNPRVSEPVATAAEVQEEAASSEFAYENDLRDYLARNLRVIAPGLTLYEDEGIRGVEFPVGRRYIDILAQDAKGYVVIELKVSRGYDRVVGQLLRYIGWIRQHHADPGQQVRGIIIAKDITTDLRLACSGLNVREAGEDIGAGHDRRLSPDAKSHVPGSDVSAARMDGVVAGAVGVVGACVVHAVRPALPDGAGGTCVGRKVWRALRELLPTCEAVVIAPAGGAIPSIRHLRPPPGAV